MYGFVGSSHFKQCIHTYVITVFLIVVIILREYNHIYNDISLGASLHCQSFVTTDFLCLLPILRKCKYGTLLYRNRLLGQKERSLILACEYSLPSQPVLYRLAVVFF